MSYNTFSGNKPSQDWRELLAFAHLASEHTSYLEVGARFGDSFYEVVRAMQVGSRAVAVDLPESAWGRARSLDSLKKCAKALRGMGYDVHLIIGDSRSPETIAKVEALGPFGIGLIDGDHRYEGVKADFENYGPMCATVGFHDIVGDGQRDRRRGLAVEVPRLWAELKQGPRVWKEFVTPGSKMGIGVLL